MKLDWKTFGCVMVAESGSYTAVIRNRAEEGDRWLQILDAKTGSLKHSASTTRGEEKAISECELWLEQHTAPSGTTSLQSGWGMKLDWKRGRYASIAESGLGTASVWKDGPLWNFQVYNEDGPKVIRFLAGSCETQEGEEKLAEDWLEQNDRPEWRDVTDWLSWAEWRGFRFVAAPSAWRPFMCQVSNGRGTMKVFHDEKSSHAKAAAEKWVREQGERA